VVELKTGRRLLAIAPNPSVDRLVEVDRLRHGEMHRPLAVTVDPGGKGFNVARSAATLGAPVTAIGLLGGHAGRWMADALAAEGIAVQAAPRTGETRTCTSILDRADGSMTELYEAGEPIGTAAWDLLLSAIERSLEDGGVGLVTVSGSLPPGAPDDGLAVIIDLVRSHTVPIGIDGHGRALVAALAAGPWLVKVNLAEAHAALRAAPPEPSTTDRDAADQVGSAGAAVRALIRAGARHAIVTIGQAGAVGEIEDGSLIHVRPPTIGRYPVGSGDAFLGGLSAATLRGEDLRGGILWGTAAAAASSLIPGVGRLAAADVQRLLAAVVIEPVS
jgi:1-phosphofructokinase family hexose kinase